VFRLFQDVVECNKADVPGMGKTDKPLCHVTSDTSGKFVFPSLITGEYYLVGLTTY